MKNRRPKTEARSAQALVEFTVALVAILAVVAGLFLLDRLEWSRIATLLAARGQAGQLALSPVYQGALDSDFIADWQPGADAARYTADDEPDLDLAALTLVDELVAGAGQFPAAGPPATNAFVRLGASPDPINEFYLVKGSASATIDLTGIPAVGNLISGEPQIEVESEAWLTWTEGIY